MLTYDKAIQEQFNKVISFSQNMDNPQTGALFEKWATAKEMLFHRMGDQLIYECPQEITFSLDKEAAEHMRNNFLEWVYGEYPYDIYNFLDVNKDGFYDNKVVVEYRTEYGETIPLGMRIGKALGRYFSKVCNSGDIQLLQEAISRKIQESCVNGRLCLSIHPLDFISSSENNHNWRSCHALDGEYRAGNLSYMCDNVTVMAYIKSAEDTILPRFPDSVKWNNKKWRCLLFFDKERNVIYAGRQYPFFSQTALNAITRYLLAPLNYFLDVKYPYEPTLEWKHSCSNGYNAITVNGDNYTLKDVYIFDHGYIERLDEIVKDAEHSLHYNDLLHSSVYTPWTFKCSDVGSFYRMKNKPAMIVGSEVPCCSCGKERIYSSEAVFCKDCGVKSDRDLEWVVSCGICGDRTFRDDDRFFPKTDEYICQDCWDNHIHKCENCGELISDYSPLCSRIYEGKDGERLCYRCFRKAQEKDGRVAPNSSNDERIFVPMYCTSPLFYTFSGSEEPYEISYQEFNRFVDETERTRNMNTRPPDEPDFVSGLVDMPVDN